MTSHRRSLPELVQDSLFAEPVHEQSTNARVQEWSAPRSLSKVAREGDVFNFRLLEGLTVVGPYGIPKIFPCSEIPDRLIAFSEAVRMPFADSTAWVHFYEDDRKFIRLWSQPELYFARLAGFAGAISPDFSIYRNCVEAQKIECTFKNQLLGARMQANGMKIIPNIRLSGRNSMVYALAGVSFASTIALGLHGCIKSVDNRAEVMRELRIICDELVPSNLIVYGSDAYGVLDYPREMGVRVHLFAPDSRSRSHDRWTAA